MAQRVEVSFLDDLDGSVATETVPLGLDGRGYEIDLSETNAAKLRDALAPYVAAARRTGANGISSRHVTRRAAGRGDTKDVRAWALEQGMKVSARGRISAEIQQAFNNRDVAPARPATTTPHDEPVGSPHARSQRADLSVAEREPVAGVPEAAFVSAG